jgi:exosome complex component RRP40
LPSQFQPAVGDLIIATVNNSAGESFNCLITPHTPYALLPQLAFEGATRKTRPVLAPNSLVYARITNAGKESSAELTCVDPSTGKSEGLGPLKGGMVFPISLGMARRLLAGKKGGVSVLEGLAEKVGFEVAVGRNGVLWVDGGKVRLTLAIGRAVQEVDEKALGEAGQKKVVEKVLKHL